MPHKLTINFTNFVLRPCPKETDLPFWHYGQLFLILALVRYFQQVVHCVRDLIVKYHICQLYLYLYLLILVIQPLVIILQSLKFVSYKNNYLFSQ